MTQANRNCDCDSLFEFNSGVLGKDYPYCISYAQAVWHKSNQAENYCQSRKRNGLKDGYLGTEAIKAHEIYRAHRQYLKCEPWMGLARHGGAEGMYQTHESSRCFFEPIEPTAACFESESEHDQPCKCTASARVQRDAPIGKRQ